MSTTAKVTIPGAPLPNFFWSPAEQAQNFGGTGTKVANVTFGFVWYFPQGARVTGVRFYSTWAGTKNIVVRIYNLTDGALVYTETFNNVVGTGFGTLTFAAAQTLLKTKNYVISTYITDTTIYQGWTFSTAVNGSTFAEGYPGLVGPYAIIRGTGFAAGNANPTTLTNITEYSSVEPVFTLP